MDLAKLSRENNETSLLKRCSIALTSTCVGMLERLGTHPGREDVVGVLALVANLGSGHGSDTVLVTRPPPSGRQAVHCTSAEKAVLTSPRALA